MNDQEKTREELIKELQELRQDYLSLKASYTKDIARGRQNEINLQLSEAQKKAILNGISSNIAFVDTSLKIIWANKTAASSVNVTPDEMIGRSCHHFWADPSKPCENCPSKKAIETKKPQQTIIYTTDGRIWEERGEPVFNDTGELIGVVEIATDITERKKAEIDLLESQVRYLDLYKNAPDMYLSVDSSTGIIKECNNTMMKKTGFGRHEVIGMSIFEIYHPDCMEEVVDTFQLFRTTGKVSDKELQVLRKDGSKLYVSLNATAMLDANGTITESRSSWRDITDRRLAEEKLRDSEAKFRSYFELPLIGITITSPEKDWIEVNEGVIEMLGYSVEELAGLTWDELTHPDDLAADEAQFNKVVADQLDTYFLEKRFIHKNGEIIWVNLSVGCVRKPDRTVDYFVALLQNINERKQAEEALRNNEERFHSLYTHMSEGAALFNLVYDYRGVPEDYRIIDANPAFEKLYGFSRETDINKTSRDLFGVDEPPYFEIYSRVALMEHPEVFETYVAALDKHFSISVYSPKKGSFAAIFENISERKKAEYENERTQKLLEDSQRIGKIGGWEVNLDTMEVKWTKEMYRIHEVDFTFNPKLDLRANFYTTGSLSIIDNAFKDAVENSGSYNVDLEIITAKGNRRFIKTIGQADIENRRVFGFFQDITERKLAEKALEESEGKYRNLFEKSNIGMFRTRIDGSEVLEVNEKLSKILGFAKDELISSPSVMRYADPKRRDDLVSLLRQSTFVNDFEAEFITKDGSVKTLLMSFTAYPEKNILEGSLVDITDRKLAEAELKIKNELLNELNATKVKFLSIIAHDLKGPLIGISGLSEILKNEVHELDMDSIVKFTEMINSSAQLTFKFLENLLDWTRMQQGGFHFEPRKILLNTLIVNELNVLKYNADQKNITITNDTNEELIITADEKMISTVLRNLISNAIKFTHKEGKIHVETKIETDHIEVSVSDNGIGMKKEALEKLFKIETNFTSHGTEKEKGTGLGLLLCKEFTEKHGGTIRAESEKGKGSRFTFTLPR